MINLYCIQNLKFIIDKNRSYLKSTFLLKKKNLLLNLHINIIFLVDVIFLNML